MMLILDKMMCDAAGLTAEERAKLSDLIDVFNAHVSKNALKNKYYEGHVTLADVNLGIALPERLSTLEVGCEWGAKTVDVLASRSLFDGFVGEDGQSAETMQRILEDNRLLSEYAKACKDELKFLL